MNADESKFSRILYGEIYRKNAVTDNGFHLHTELARMRL